MADFEQKTKILTQVIITAILLIACLSMIFLDYPEDNKKWAMGLIGVVVGYWLK